MAYGAWTNYSSVMQLEAETLSHKVYIGKYGDLHVDQAFSIYEASKTWTRPDSNASYLSMSYRRLKMLTERLMRYEENFHNFMKLPSKHQSNIQVHLDNMFSPRTLDLFLRALSLAGNPEPVFIRLDLQNVEKFETSLRKAGVDLKTASRSFNVITLDYAEAQLKGWSLLTVLHLLRAFSCEETVLEILARMDSEDIDWAQTDIVEICKNWEDLKNYPMTWTVESMAY